MTEISLWIILGVIIGSILSNILRSRNTAYGRFIINTKDLEKDVYHIKIDTPIYPTKTKYIYLKIEDDIDDSQE